MAQKHIDALVTVMGIGRKKCVIVDLDGTLWPGVLAETGSPFAWTPEISGAFSFIGLYFGLHEALKCLKRRGVVLACVSKNDEATVRELWKYPEHYPAERLLTPDDFVTWRVNWDDKVGNIRSIAEELGFALDAFLFIDDNAGRARPRAAASARGGSLGRGSLRPAPPPARRSAIADSGHHRRGGRAQRTGQGADRAAAAAQPRRSARRNTSSRCGSNARIEQLVAGSSPKLQRVEELFQRTTQFNTTGRKFSCDRAGGAGGKSRRAPVRDRSVGPARRSRPGRRGRDRRMARSPGLRSVAARSAWASSIRFLRHMLDEMKPAVRFATRIMPTPRNIPARNIYRDNGFVEAEGGIWQFARLSRRLTPGFAGARVAAIRDARSRVLFPNLSGVCHETARNIFTASVIFR